VKDNNLLASVALFSELYNNDKYNDVTDILAEFIKSAVVANNKWSITSTELNQLLKTDFDFDIPEGVVRTTLKTKLKEVAKNKEGEYVFNTSIKQSHDIINRSFTSIRQKQSAILDQLVQYVENQEGNILDAKGKENLIENFNRYLLGNSINEKDSRYISAFIISNQLTPNFTENLNLIKEGLILYQGIVYTADLNEMGKWSTDLIIVLSTEHLFNSAGFNGTLFQQLFNDFYNLTKEINLVSKNKNHEGAIQLRYFDETKDEIDSFFQTAEAIIKGTATLDTSRPAMKAILDGCRHLSDVKVKKVKFESELKNKGILLKEFKQSIYQHHDLVIDGDDMLEEIKKQTETNGRIFDEALCRRLFSIFTKINYMRGGLKETKIERIQSIFITANSFALYLAHNPIVKTDDGIPFAKDIDYITSRFWFKLKKGFNNKSALPKAFDIVTKAQIVISSQLNQNVFEHYQLLQKQLKDGDINLETAKQLTVELRQKPNVPEAITIDTIDNTLNFLTDESYFENVQRELDNKNLLLKQTQEENRRLSDELKARDEIVLSAQRQKLAEERVQRLDAFVAENWRSYAREQNRNSLYCGRVMLLTFLPIIIGLIVKTLAPLNEWLAKLGGYQYIFWIVLGLIFLLELFGRAYIFNKDRVKSGWNWAMMICISRGQYTTVRNLKTQEFKTKFDIDNTSLDNHPTNKNITGYDSGIFR